MYKKSKKPTEIIRKVDNTLAEEQLSLISYLIQRLKMCKIKKRQVEIGQTQKEYSNPRIGCDKSKSRQKN